MTERLLTEEVHVARDLDSAILWAENVFLALAKCPTSPLRPTRKAELSAPAAQLAVLMPRLARADRNKLAAQFTARHLQPGEILWQMHDPASSIVVVANGTLISILDDERSKTPFNRSADVEETAEEVSAGQMCGESAALTGGRRPSTVACALEGPAQIYVLGERALASLPPDLKLELALLSMRYMAHRLDHVANRIWETRCVPI
jgi:CRP-like cAMP-binding protein